MYFIACSSWSVVALKTNGKRENRQVARELRAMVVDDLDIVAVGVENVRRVVPGVVARPLVRRAVALVAGARGDLVEALDHGVVVARERQVEVLGRDPGDERERAGRPGELRA